jgi:6-phosphogluconate dehydrogenase
MLILVTGVSGTGKTTLGTLISERLRLPFFDADHFHPEENIAKMSTGQPLNDEDREPWLAALADQLVSSEKIGGAVLACSALKNNYRQKLSVSDNLRWIHLTGDRELIWQRMQARKNHYMKAGMLDSQIASWEKPEAGLLLDVTGTPEELLEKSLHYLLSQPMKMKMGVIGMGVMGKSLGLNLAEKGVPVSLYNRFVAGKEEGLAQKAVDENPEYGNMAAFEDLQEFVDSLEKPRRILMMIPAGSAIDLQLEQLLPRLESGDLVIDGGNSFYKDSELRVNRLKELGIRFLPMGVSGGEEGARKGPSIMPGGTYEGYQMVEDFLGRISAKDKDGKPCVTYVGPGGSGHFIKMVHNSIEYGEMQVLAELVHLLRFGFDCSAEEVSEFFSEWGKGDLRSFLLEITAEILLFKENGELLLDKILDQAGQKGTGSWSLTTALEYGIPYSPLAEAVNARGISGEKAMREAFSKTFCHEFQKIEEPLEIWLPKIKEAYSVARIINHETGFRLMETASEAQNWDLNFNEIARIWTSGCIIRSHLMETISNNYSEKTTFFEMPGVKELLISQRKSLAELVGLGLSHGFSMPVMSAGINYLLGRITAESSASVIQAQRDYFGAHTYQRKDDSEAKFHHTKWK